MTKALVVIVSLLLAAPIFAADKSKLWAGGALAVGGLALHKRATELHRDALETGSTIRLRRARQYDLFSVGFAFGSAAFFGSYALDVRLSRRSVEVAWKF